MKKSVLAIAATAAILSSRANLVNGNFSAPEAGRLFDVKSLSAIDKGWYASNPSVPHFEIVNGAATLNSTTAATSPARIGQFFTYAETGERILKFDVTLTDSNANINFRVQLYGYKQRTGQNTILFGNALKLSNDTPPVSSEYYEVKELVNYASIRTGTLNHGNTITETVNFSASAEYAFYGIRIIANRPDADDKISFDNVSIAPVPSP